MLWNFQNLALRIFLLTYLLIYLLMPSDKHNSRMARARDLVSSLINVASSWDVPFYQQQLLQCLQLHQGVTFVLLCAPILSSQPCKVTICGTHVMASVRSQRHFSCYALLTMLWNEFDSVEIEALYGFHVSRYGAHVSYSVMAGWIAEMLHAVLCLYCYVTDRT